MDRCLVVGFASCLAACFVDLGGGDTATTGGSTATSADEPSGGDLPPMTTGADTSGSAETTTADDPTTGAADESTGLIKPLNCGDGMQDSNEDCDDGNNMSGDGCSAECLLEEALCGDEHLDPGEQCDDGNHDDGDGCSAFCELELGCGDGIKLASEACDDGNTDADDGCDNNCELQFLYAFVTEAQYTGMLGGVGGADAICQMEAAGKLPGTYRAWIASSVDDRPAVRFAIHAGTPYRLPDRATTIVGAFMGLNNDVMHPIDQTADATPVVPGAMDCASDRNVWTALDKDGNVVVGGHCEGWQSEAGDAYGHSGYLDAASELWTSACLANCSSVQRLYCFQQAP